MEKTTYAIAVKRFFELDAKPVSAMEMMTFWKALSPEEKREFGEAAGVALGIEVGPA